MPREDVEGIRLLIVDDEEPLRRALRRLLEKHGVEVVGEAGDGQEGIRLVEQLSPDAVLMDLRMPLLDGIEACIQIRAKGSTVPILLHTAYADPVLHRDARAAGATACLVKGCLPQEIRVALGNVTQGVLG